MHEMLSPNFNDGSRSFDVLITGRWRSGTKTLIRALLGVTRIPVSSIYDGLNNVELLQYGCKKDCVEVYERDSTKPRTLTIDEYKAEYTIPNYLAMLAVEDIIPTKPIDLIVTECNSKVLRDGMRLICADGIDADIEVRRQTYRFLSAAGAIVFILDAGSLFSEFERDYIDEHFAGRCLRNAFFVVNNIDHLNSPYALEEKVKPAVRAHLEAVFTDENGRFDEELYNKRIFYINAHAALCLRTGEPYTILCGKKPVPVEIEIEDTGIDQLEKALREFRAEREEYLYYSRERLQRMMQGRREI